MSKKKRKINNKVIYLFIGIIFFSVIIINIVMNRYSKNMQTKISDINVDDEIDDENELKQASSDIESNIVNNQDISKIEEKNNIVDKTLKKDEDVKENKDNNKINNKSKVKSVAVNNKQKENQSKKKELNFIKPVIGEIIKGFAKDNLVYSNTLEEWTTHLGIDIKADKGTVVKATEEGIVKFIKNDPRYGITVVIEHSNGFESQYSNLLTAEFVAEGEKVSKGQTIATVGNSAIFEVEDDSHLHFELKKDNQNVDPTVYLK